MLDTEQTYLITIPEVATMCGIPQSTAYALAQKDQLPFEVLVFGTRARRCRLADVEEFLRGSTGRISAVPSTESPQ